MAELTHNQKVLMSASGEESVRDWTDNLTDERLRKSRVMVKKLIRAGDPDILDIIAEYYGVRIIRDEVIEAEVKRLQKMVDENYPVEEHYKVDFERVRAILLHKHSNTK